MDDKENNHRSTTRRRRRFCLISLSISLILIILIISILCATIFKARRPIITVKSITLRDLDTSFDALNLKLHFNVSLDASLSVKNPNKVGFKYGSSSADLYYRGQVVGQAPIPAGEISVGQTKPIDITLTVMADRVLSDPQGVISDVVGGELPLSTKTRISGKVRVLFVKVHVVSYSNCRFNVSVSSRSVSGSDCTYKTHLS